MTKLTPYLFFSGNCREAMEFYKQCFGGNLEVMTYGDHDDSCPAAMKTSVMHAYLTNGELALMASDSPFGETTVGSNVQINANFGSVAEINKTFKAISEDGEVVSELHDAFWGDRFGVIKDRYGVQWMFTCPLK